MIRLDILACVAGGGVRDTEENLSRLLPFPDERSAIREPQSTFSLGVLPAAPL